VIVTVVGFHTRWNGEVGVRHPNLWHFIRKLKDEERRVQRQIRAVDRGDAPPTKKRRYRQLQERVSRLKADYVAGMVAGRRSLNGPQPCPQRIGAQSHTSCASFAELTAETVPSSHVASTASICIVIGFYRATQL